MSTIIAGEFETREQADGAMEALLAAGVGKDDYCVFAVGPPGQHDQYPIGGDRDESPGATHADGGSAKGAAVGGAVGLAVGAVGGPVGAALGAGVGAYTGSLVGALGSMDSVPVTGSVRKAGVLVAVNAGRGKVPADQLARLLQTAGAHPVERTEGRWSMGNWDDFDPVARTRPLFPASLKA